MFTTRSSAVLLSTILAAGIAPSARADNQVPYSDAAFAVADWSLTNYGNRIATATQNPNGFSGTCRRVSHPLDGGSSVSVYHKYLPADASIDPASGAISSIGFSIKCRFIGGTGSNGQQVGLAIEQGGVAYFTSDLTTGVSGNWVTRTGSYTDADFQRFDGQPGTPDFSAAGAPITFGFRTGNGNAGAVVNQQVNYDDLVITVHRNTIVAGDTEFALADWSITPFTTGAGGNATATQPANSGNPGSCRRVVHSINGGIGTMQAFHKYLPASGTILPSQGAIDRIEMTLDAKYLSGVGGNGHAIGIALEQGGIAYRVSGQVTNSSGNWITRQSPWLKASDFARFDGLAGSPDFSTSGGPIQLGFRTSNTNSGGGSFNQIVSYDNWSVRVHFVACPSDFTSDGAVDDSDFVDFAAAYSILDCADPAMPAGCPADFNSDGFVDDSDFVAFAAAYETLLCP